MGDILYLDYDHLPRGKSSRAELRPHLSDYVEGDRAEQEELADWFQEGAPLKGGKHVFTKDILDDIFHSCEKTLTEELVVYKSGERTHSGDRWISTSTLKGAYKDLGKEVKITLPKGAKVIFADGIADDHEVIINTSEIPK